MKATSTKLNKILWVLCIVAAVFCVAMAAWFLLLGGSTEQLQQAQAQAADAQQRLAEADAAVAQAKEENEQLAVRVADLRLANQEKAELVAEAQLMVDRMANLPEAVMEVRREYGAKVRQLEELIMAGKTDVKICYLTFDDGPNNLTLQMVEKVEELGAYATFFTIGANDAPLQEENLRRELMGGHTVGNHTFSHAYYGPLYRTFDEFKLQVQLQDQKVFEATGFHTEIFRFPSGSMACYFLDEATAWLEEYNHKWIDWNATGWDSGMESFEVGGETIAWGVYSTVTKWDIAVVLLHDFNMSTYQGLDIMIPRLRNEGYIFLPLFIESHMFDEPLPVV